MFEDDLGDYTVTRPQAPTPAPQEPAPAPEPLEGALTLDEISQRLRGHGFGHTDLPDDDDLDEGWNAGQFVKDNTVQEHRTGPQVVGAALRKMYPKK
jgi:hypothetical protein